MTEKIHATRGYFRSRICTDCGTIEKVRQDNKATRCARCSNSLSLSKARSIRYSRTPANTVQCKTCGCVFHRVPSQKAIYCSRMCRKEDKTSVRICLQCQSAFRVNRSVTFKTSNSRGNFCCRPCYNAFLHTGAGRFDRGPGWRTARLQAIKLNPFCALCGTTKNLHVHHIVPYRISRSSALENLIPLCRRDHKRVEHFFLQLEPFEKGMTPEMRLWHRRYSLVEQQTITRFRLSNLIKEIPL